MQGVTVPKSQPEVAPAKFGFVDNAERIKQPRLHGVLRPAVCTQCWSGCQEQ